MFEGKNIHLSPIDGKPLCSFSRKLCRQRRLHGYAFCIRHILEDTNAPFKQCQYQTKSGDTCINPVPITATRSYCNNHMNVLGLLTKPVKKVVEKPITTGAQNGGLKKPNSKNINRNKKRRENRLLKQQRALELKKNNEHWSHSLKKNLLLSERKYQLWKNKNRSNVFKEFMDDESFNWNSSTNSVDAPTSYRLGSVDDIPHIESFQSVLLTNHERVHHNVLREDSILMQESKLVNKLKHQYAQLRYVLDQKSESRNLSYSVLSRLTAAAKANSTETCNIINHHQQREIEPIRIMHSPLEKTRCVIPCCMITDDKRCTKPTLPYTRYCHYHINEDSEQLVFVPRHAIDCNDLKQSPMLKIFRADNDAEIMKFDGNINGKLVQNKRNLLKKPQRKAGSKNPLKRTTSTKKSNTKNNLKLKCIKDYGLHQRMAQTSRTNAHVRTETVTENQNELPTISTPPILSESSSSYTESDSESDILTPEEAFHLPPGSLSFPTGLDDDDALSGIRHSSRTCGIDEEEELMRCDTNFTMDTDKQDMIGRELSSPTLNQLSDFDSSLGMFLSRSETTVDLSPSTVPSSTGSLSNSLTTFTTINTTPQPTTDNIFNHKLAASKPKPINPSLNRFKPTSNSISTSKGSATTLKISPLNMTHGQFSSRSLGFSPKQPIKPLLTNSYEQSLASVASVPLTVKPPIINTSFSTNHHSSQANAKPVNGHAAKDELGVWNKQYMQIDNFCESDLLNDMAMDEETPLEKVNPDIFFSSAFPVSSNSTDM